MSAGFYLMHRGWMDHPVLNAAREPFCRRSAWAWMIEEAAWKPTRVAVGGRWVELDRGQFTHSLRFMAAAWRWSEPSVRRFLVALSRADMVRTKTDAGQMVVTLCNYDKFQVVGEAPDAEATQTRRRPDAEKKEGKEGKEDSHPSDGAPAAPGGQEASSAPGVGNEAPPSARDILWRQGLSILAHLTGKPAGRCRSFLGRLLGLAGDDCAMVMMKLYEAQSMHPLAEAEAWLMRACDTKGKRPAARKSRMAWMRDDPQFAALVGRAPPPAAKTASPDLNIIDASEWEEAR